MSFPHSNGGSPAEEKKECAPSFVGNPLSQTAPTSPLIDTPGVPLDDLRQVFNASLQFESNNTLPMMPRHSTMDFRCPSSSSSGLYPSLESLEQTDSVAVDLNKQWEAASFHWPTQRLQGDSIASSRTTSAIASLPQATATNWRAETNTTFAGLGTATAARLPTTASDDDDEDMIALKLAAYGGAASALPKVAAVPKPRSWAAHNDTVEATLVHYDDAPRRNTAVVSASIEGTALHSPATPHSEPTSGEHIGRDHVSRPWPTCQVAEVTMIDTDDARQAAEQSELVTPVIASLQHRNVIMEPAYRESTGPSFPGTSQHTWRAATAEPWSNHLPAEATVMMQEVAYDLAEEEEVVEDCKPAARDPDRQLFQVNGHAVATVLDDDVHPSEHSIEAVQAELLGQDYHATTDHTVGRQTNIPGASSTYEVFDDALDDEHVMEVAVIESGPMEKATVEAWSASTSGQAQVISEEVIASGQGSTFQSKASPFSTSSDQWHDGIQPTSNRGTSSMVAGEAEVIDISEEVHPAELIGEATAEAELVGPDFNTAIGVPSSEAQEGTITLADIVVEECDLFDGSSMQRTPPREARATLVQQSEQPGFDVSGGMVTVVQAEFSGETSGQLPATPVTVLEEPSIPEVLSSVSFSDYVKEQPYAGTGTNVHVAQAQVAREAVDDRPEWDRAPSFGGGRFAPEPIPAPPVADIDGVPPIPKPEQVGVECSFGRNRSKSSNSSTSDSPLPGLQMLSSGIARGANNVMETLFGNVPPGARGAPAPANVDLDTMSGSVLPRTLLPSSVIFSETTKSWVATINTNQKALEANNVEESSKSLRAFSVPTQKQAVALARAWAPPQMHPFASNPTCLICEAQFAVFRRACHCRNCGVCICGPCSLQWPVKMLPVTYNIKKESTVTICRACDWLCTEFRLALLRGDHDKVVALYSTGNINLTTPFANVKGELFYPVHCAVLGGNLAVLKWLVDEHCCPLRSIRISNGKVRGSSGGSYTPILTSKGRSLLGIAIGNRNIGIVRYLVVEKRMLLSAEKGLSVETLTANLDLVLRILPESAIMEQALDSSGRVPIRSGAALSDSRHQYDSSDMGEISAIRVPDGPDEDSGGTAEDSDVCIICFDATINCVFTPCGHQICCLTCGNNISRCPVCSVECAPMRVFKP